MRYIGSDVHKNNTAACVISAGGKAVKTLEVRSSQSGLQAVHDRILSSTGNVLM
jgi:predicted NBD/HSP70 family sugar kinase